MQGGDGRGQFYNAASYRGVGLHDGIGKEEPEIRYTFLLFFLFVFQGYEKFVTDVTKQQQQQQKNSSTSPSRAAAAASSSNQPSSLFDREGFMYSDHLKGLNEASYNALSKLISSQMFERFLQEFVTHDQRLDFNDGTFDRSEIRFFNEKILEKQNRSTSVFSNAHLTPFLDDKSDIHAETFSRRRPRIGAFQRMAECIITRAGASRPGSVAGSSGPCAPAALVKSAELVRSTSSMALSAHAMMLHASAAKEADSLAATNASNAASASNLSPTSASASAAGAAGGRRGRRPSGDAKMLEVNRLAIPDCRSRIGQVCSGMDRFRALYAGWRLRRAIRDRKYLREGILLQSVARRWLQVRDNRRRAVPRTALALDARALRAAAPAPAEVGSGAAVPRVPWVSRVARVPVPARRRPGAAECGARATRAIGHEEQVVGVPSAASSAPLPPLAAREHECGLPESLLGPLRSSKASPRRQHRGAAAKRGATQEGGGAKNWVLMTMGAEWVKAPPRRLQLSLLGHSRR